MTTFLFSIVYGNNQKLFLMAPSFFSAWSMAKELLDRNDISRVCREPEWEDDEKLETAGKLFF